MTILSTWRPHRWSQSWSLIASNAASTILRFCSTLIPSSTPLLRIGSGVFRLDERRSAAALPKAPLRFRSRHGSPKAFNGLAASVRLSASYGSAHDSNGYRRDAPEQLDRL